MRLLGELAALAALDSINPCTFYIYAVLLLSVSLKERRSRAVLAAGLAFVAGIYAGYTLLGLGIAGAASRLSAWLLSLAAGAYGVYNIAVGLYELRGGRPGLQRPGVRLAPRAVRTAGLLGAAGLGLLLSFTLLPCSGGPLVAFIVLARASGYQGLAVLPLLMLYNVIFVSPLVGMGLAVSALYRVERVQHAVTRAAPYASIAAGAALVAVAVYVAGLG
ncbi:hypothetical protein CF15_01980 [Pyrodictium occultum]|uniref:Uncharacterized protein n=1 Tax=Pyrodictium occultum TaxID=2309 RepID=A0A0V8RU85_PYROC|nr:cytochrome c biogenesis protein CcdA [Pyrodictium occultum]KSW11622.1 hypothetical protein CF15_01980 [Pyrodictium occultum]